MASLLFDINKKGNQVLRPEAVKLCPELAFLKEEEVLFIILAYDYGSPYNQFPEEDRVRKAIYHVYGADTKPALEKKIIKDGVIAYMALQYDPRREQIKMYQRKKALVNKELEDTTNATTIKGQMKTIKDLQEAIAEIQKEVKADTERQQAKIRGGETKSWLEEMHSNKEEYERIRRGN